MSRRALELVFVVELAGGSWNSVKFKAAFGMAQRRSLAPLTREDVGGSDPVADSCEADWSFPRAIDQGGHRGADPFADCCGADWSFPRATDQGGHRGGDAVAGRHLADSSFPHAADHGGHR